eukprot:5706213-Pyramimonas_sp.AAC.1
MRAYVALAAQAESFSMTGCLLSTSKTRLALPAEGARCHAANRLTSFVNKVGQYEYVQSRETLENEVVKADDVAIVAAAVAAEKRAANEPAVLLAYARKLLSPSK